MLKKRHHPEPTNTGNLGHKAPLGLEPARLKGQGRPVGFGQSKPGADTLYDTSRNHDYRRGLEPETRQGQVGRGPAYADPHTRTTIFDKKNSKKYILIASREPVGMRFLIFGIWAVTARKC
jgi:hypothetical protein